MPHFQDGLHVNTKSGILSQSFARIFTYGSFTPFFKHRLLLRDRISSYCPGMFVTTV